MQNTVSYQQIAKNTVILYLRMLLNMVVTFYTSRIVLDALGVNDYGIYNVVGGVVIIFTFLNTAMSSSTQRFITFEIGKKSDSYRMSRVFSTSLNVHGLIAILILILCETIGLYFLNTQMVFPSERMIAVNVVYQCSIVSCCLGVMTIPFNAIIISYERMGVFAWISIFDVALKLAVAYLLYITTFDKLIIYAIFILFVSLITPLVYICYCYRNFFECRRWHVRDNILFKDMCSFAGWNLIGNFAYICFTQGVNILLNIFCGPSVNAARGIAVQMQGAVGRFAGGFQTAVNPQITKQYANGDLKSMYTLLYRSSKFSFFLLFIISFPVVLQAETILNWWLVDVPDYTVSFFRIIICISLIDVLATPMNISAQATGRIKKYQLLEGGTLLLIVPISYFTLKISKNPNSVFVVHFFIALITQMFRIVLLKDMIKLSVREYLKAVIYRILCVLIVSILVIYFIGVSCPYIIDDFFICTLISFLLVAISVFICGLTVSERSFLFMVLKKYLVK